MTRALIAMGTNLPHEGAAGPALLTRAVAALAAAGLAPRTLSAIWETSAWPDPSQPNYFNAVAELDCGPRGPQPLYAALRAIEAAFGRSREGRYGARTLDLDVLAVDGFVGTFGAVILPHPRLHERGFVLAPLGEVAPGWRHPILGRSAGEMLAELQNPGLLTRIGPFPAG